MELSLHLKMDFELHFELNLKMKLALDLKMNFELYFQLPTFGFGS